MKPLPLLSHSARRRAAAFSLPEVAIAVAIAALALVTVMGLLPSGLDSVRRSGQITSEARIIRQVTGALQLTDWGQQDPTSGIFPQLQTILANNWYFDDEANQITNNNQSDMSNLAYVVRVRQPGNGGIAAQPKLPGSPNPSTNATVLLLDIAATNQTGYSFENSTTYTTFPSILARQLYSTPLQ